MSVLMLHGIRRAFGDPMPEAPRHQRIGFGALEAITTAATSAAAEADTEETAARGALIHHRLLVAYQGAAGILPVRYGTAFSGAAELRAALLPREAELADALRQIEGCAEYVLSVVTLPVAPPDAAPVANGRDFLQARRASRDNRRSQQTRRRTFVAALMEDVAACTIAAVPLRLSQSDDTLARHAILADRARAHHLADALRARELEATSLALTLRLTGPGPCYSFVPAHPADAVLGAA